MPVNNRQDHMLYSAPRLSCLPSRTCPGPQSPKDDFHTHDNHSLFLQLSRILPGPLTHLSPFIPICNRHSIGYTQVFLKTPSVPPYYRQQRHDFLQASRIFPSPYCIHISLLVHLPQPPKLPCPLQTSILQAGQLE